MERIDFTVEKEMTMPGVLASYFEGLGFGVLDIETTGLSAERNKLILGGLLTADGGRMRVMQFFAENRSEETEVLDELLRAAGELDCVFTYNGASFDMPFIARRAVACGVETAGRLPGNVDLYNILNRYSVLRRILPNLKQKTVEAYCGLAPQRSDEISGAESVAMYDEFCRTGRVSLKEKILLHNADDLVQLAGLLPLVKKADIHRAMSELGFPCAGGLYATRAGITRNAILVKGCQNKRSVDYRGFVTASEGYIELAGEERSFEILVPLIEYEGMRIVDLQAIGGGSVKPDFSELEGYPTCGSGYLAVACDGVCNHRELNHFVRLYAKYIVREAFD